MILFEKFMLFVEPTALAFLLVYAFGFFSRALVKLRQVNVAMGLIFGAVSMAAMASPIPIADGVIVDIRNLFIGIAAAYFGLVGGAIAFVIGSLMRLGIGGDGALLGVMGMATAGLMGLAWAQFVRPRLANDTTAFLALGMMISVHLAIGVLLPPAIRATFFHSMAPVLLLANLIGAFVLSKLIAHERNRLAETDRLRSVAFIDPLTQVLNRDGVLKRYAALPNVRGSSLGTAMLCIDVDGFKRINDTHGHLNGDQVLVCIAQRIGACLRPDDVFARLSGDEFVVLLNDLKPEQAKAVADRCRSVISQEPVSTNGGDINTSISIGGTWTRHRPDFNDLRAVADEALYLAKSRGRDRVTFDGSDKATKSVLSATAA